MAKGTVGNSWRNIEDHGACCDQTRGSTILESSRNRASLDWMWMLIQECNSRPTFALRVVFPVRQMQSSNVFILFSPEFDPVIYFLVDL